MNNSPYKEYELLSLIVNLGMGSKVVKIAKTHGIKGATILLGMGTVKSHLLEILGIYEIRKEIVLMIAEKEIAYSALDTLSQKLSLSKPNHGIAFTVSVSNLLGTKNCTYNNLIESKKGEKAMYNAIFVVVDKGKAEEVIDAANAAGSRGGTIINGRGSGIHETSKLFSMEIEPEKEIVMILSKNDTTEAIVSSIRKELNIDEPGKGIIFVLDVNKTYGLY